MHDSERIVVNVAIQLNGRLDAPVVFVVHHERLSEEESGFETTHVTIADRVTVDDLALSHVLAHLLGLVLINPLRERPMLWGDLAIVRLTGDQRCCDLFEGLIEGLVVEEDPVVAVSAVESVLDLAD